MPDAPKTTRERLALRLFHLWFLLTRPMTLGVRALVIDDQDGVAGRFERPFEEGDGFFEGRTVVVHRNSFSMTPKAVQSR